MPKFKSDQLSSRRRSVAFDMWTDTTLGGNYAINSPSQATESCDLVVRSPFAGTGKDSEGFSRGMGRRYAEVIDQHNQLIHMRFGVPQFNPILRVIGHSYDPEQGVISRQGRARVAWFGIGKVLGTIVTLPLQPFFLVGEAYNYFTRQPSSKYYFLKPSMHLFWQAANGMANAIAVNMGIIPQVFAKSGSESNPADTSYEPGEKPRGVDGEEESVLYNAGDIVQGPSLSKYDMDIFYEKMPDVYRRNGGVDLYAIASRAQRLGNQVRSRQEQMLEGLDKNFTYEQLTEAYANFLDNTLKDIAPKETAFPLTDGVRPGINAYLQAWSTTETSKPKEGEYGDNNESDNEGVLANVKNWTSDFIEFSKSELADGGQYVTFRVNHTGTVSESISNSVGDTQVAGVFNSTSSDFRNKFMSFQGGIAGGALGSALTSVMGAVEGLVGGALNSVKLGGLMGVFGKGYIDIPKVWQDSSVNFTKHNYTIELRSPYGAPMARYQKLMIPLSILLTAALPKSVGKHSYDSPFLVEIYDKGRGQTRLGMISDMTIRRGTGNIGWTKDHEPLGIDVDFSVVDLSSIMHMPMNMSPGLFDEYSTFNDYMGTLGSMSLDDMINPGSTFRYRLTQSVTRFQTWFSPARHAQVAANDTLGSVFRAIARESERHRL